MERCIALQRTVGIGGTPSATSADADRQRGTRQQCVDPRAQQLADHADMLPCLVVAATTDGHF